MEERPKSRQNRAFLWLLIGLLFLRFPFIFLSRFGNWPLSRETANVCFEYADYALLALAILVCRHRLADYHIDLPALILFLTAPALKLFALYRIFSGRTATQTADPWVNVVLACLLSAALLRWKPNVEKRGAKEIVFWLLVTFAASLCLSIVTGRTLQIYGAYCAPDTPFSLHLGTFCYQLGYAATLEEPLFRGFLWGFLKERGWRDITICFFQAALFMLGHLYYLGPCNLVFFVGIPALGLVLGLLAWKSRSIGTSMLAHAFINSDLGFLAAALIWR